MARKKTDTKVKTKVYDHGPSQRWTNVPFSSWDLSHDEKDYPYGGVAREPTLMGCDAAEFNWKYGEGDLIDNLKEYIKTTYGQHYANIKTGTQVLDMYESIGIAIPSCQANAIKYLFRYGKKKGEEKKDLMKSLHYTLLLIHFIEMKNREEMEKE